jgi:hypothetical protein
LERLQVGLTPKFETSQKPTKNTNNDLEKCKNCQEKTIKLARSNQQPQILQQQSKQQAQIHEPAQQPEILLTFVKTAPKQAEQQSIHQLTAGVPNEHPKAKGKNPRRQTTSKDRQSRG